MKRDANPAAAVDKKAKGNCGMVDFARCDACGQSVASEDGSRAVSFAVAHRLMHRPLLRVVSAGLSTAAVVLLALVGACAPSPAFAQAPAATPSPAASPAIAASPSPAPDDDPFTVDVIGKAILGVDSLSQTQAAAASTGTNTNATFGADVDVWSPLVENSWYGEGTLSLSQTPGQQLDLTNVDTFSRDIELKGSIEKRLSALADLHTFAYCEGGFINSFGGQVLQNFLQYYDCGIDFKKATGQANEAAWKIGYGRNPVNNDNFEWGQLFLGGHIHFVNQSSIQIVLGGQFGLNVKSPPSVPDGVTRRSTGLLWVGVNLGAKASGD